MQEVVRHGSRPTKPNLTTPEIVEQFPCRTRSVSNTFLRPGITLSQHVTHMRPAQPLFRSLLNSSSGRQEIYS